MVFVEKTLDNMLHEIRAREMADFIWIDSSTMNPYEIDEATKRIHLAAFDLSEALGLAEENSIRHGSDNSTFTYSIKLFIGSNGKLVRLRDSGNGFDSCKTIADFRRNKRYFTIGGAGFRSYDDPLLEVSFENNGTTINIMKMDG